MNLNNYEFINIKSRYYNDFKIQQWFFDEFVKELTYYKKNFVIVKGSNWEEKENFIEQVIEKELNL